MMERARFFKVLAALVAAPKALLGGERPEPLVVIQSGANNLQVPVPPRIRCRYIDRGWEPGPWLDLQVGQVVLVPAPLNVEVEFRQPEGRMVWVGRGFDSIRIHSDGVVGRYTVPGYSRLDGPAVDREGVGPGVHSAMYEPTMKEVTVPTWEMPCITTTPKVMARD